MNPDKLSREGSCLIWTGALDRGMPFAKINGKKTMLRKHVYETNYGTIPEGRKVKMTCGCDKCLNHEHMHVLDDVDLKNRTVEEFVFLWMKTDKDIPKWVKQFVHIASSHLKFLISENRTGIVVEKIRIRTAELLKKGLLERNTAKMLFALCDKAKPKIEEAASITEQQPLHPSTNKSHDEEGHDVRDVFILIGTRDDGNKNLVAEG